MPMKKPPRILKTSHCSPARYCTHKRTGTCLLPDEILPILHGHGVKPPATASPVQLVSLLHRTLANLATTEQSLASRVGANTKDTALRKKITEAYRPMAPPSWSVGSSKWLSSDDIERVMRQYEMARPDFKFIGVSPIDFAERPVIYGGRCVSPEMCALDVPGLVRAGRITHMGLVLNMDEHDLAGSHWVAVYVGLDRAAPNFGAFYYDSVATPPGSRVLVWMQGIAKVMNVNSKKGGKRFRIAHNTVRRQFGQSECGIFSMMFLIHCMQRQSSFNQICKMLGKDDAMRTLRTVLFRPAAPQQASLSTVISRR